LETSLSYFGNEDIPNDAFLKKPKTSNEKKVILKPKESLEYVIEIITNKAPKGEYNIQARLGMSNVDAPFLTEKFEIE